MPVTECYEYEGKTVDQLAAIFLEKKINLSIISPRKIPILFEIFEKSGGDLALTASKNYSKDPRHLVLLKGFSLKERPASPTMNQPAQSATPNVLPNPQPTSLMQNNEQPNTMGINPGMRQMNPNIRQNNPQMISQQQPMGNPPPPFAGGPQMNNFPQRQANPQQQQATQQQRWIAPNQTRPPFLSQQGSNMIPTGNMPQNPMMQPNQANLNQQQPQNSALISQLTQPPNINAMTPQQQAMARIAAMQNQQQPNMVPNVMQSNQQMMAGNQVNQQQNVQGMTSQNQALPQQGIQQISELMFSAVTATQFVNFHFRSSTATGAATATNRNGSRRYGTSAYLARNFRMERQAESAEHNAPGAMRDFRQCETRNERGGSSWRELANSVDHAAHAKSSYHKRWGAIAKSKLIYFAPSDYQSQPSVLLGCQDRQLPMGSAF